ncbi:hypothetical protein G3N55_02410 [Dissulfurirhabdus thermomarina]|uniref:PhoU domain-containing protein n=1 Tax=Dissulfurirhabdus thermomarina TaxID=1765737 RepID=A0A6N9TT47_DISTH|nr:PhoU domain-containing protein [Dissulfurirhabdus thermomarina]NDY41706.1 hypothetical protein [Dissulfurirhabdus thermomarina]NMX23191.1 hypothetical protein [Dissulfurirhabdus thermomarina]
MLYQLFKLFTKKESLVTEARAEALRMMDQARHMFETVMTAMLATADDAILSRVKDLDKEINEVQRDVRKKVLEHLVFCRGEDLVEAIILLTVVVDLERIGDYTKNLGELVVMLPERCCWGKKADVVKELQARTVALFDKVRGAFEGNDEKAAREALVHYREIADACEQHLREVFEAASGEEFVPREFLHLVLIFRYLKRVSAHLKNVATTVINPVDQIGFVKAAEAD